MPGDGREVTEGEATEMFEPPSWDDRYSGEAEDLEREPQRAAGGRDVRD